MVETAIAITPKGPFSWEAAMDVIGNFSPMTQHWEGSSELVRMTFPLDGSFVPVGVALRFRDGRLHAEVTGSDDLRRVERQVARIFSLDHDGTEYPAIGGRDPEVGGLMAALPGLRPLNFSSPYETAAWGVMSQRISMRQAARVKAGLIAAHGTRLSVAGEEVSCFPTPGQLAGVDSIAGLNAEKVDRLKAVARAALDGKLDPDRLRQLGDEAGPASVGTFPASGPSGPPESTSGDAASSTSFRMSRSRSPRLAICMASVIRRPDGISTASPMSTVRFACGSASSCGWPRIEA